MKYKETLGEKTFTFINHVFMIIFALVIIYPILLVFSRSFMGDAERSLRPLAVFRSIGISQDYFLLFFHPVQL